MAAMLRVLASRRQGVPQHLVAQRGSLRPPEVPVCPKGSFRPTGSSCHYGSFRPTGSSCHDGSCRPKALFALRVFSGVLASPPLAG
eukprot:2374624-Amphidinium_carterae.1